ncbi:Zinc finger and SCAN domain-containing protein 22 [Lucilia cuprina]|nr:Zinc finger and SCAN domain-containing protein 22 [Lucilia cuprina]
MNDLKMGFKQSLLQRLQHIEMSAPQSKSSAESKDSNNTQITDFSIQRILADNKQLIENGSKSKSPSSTQQDTPPSSPKLYAPIATKPTNVATADILDLSKSKQTDSYSHPLLASPPSSNEFPFNPTPNYAGFHPNILAAVAAANAQKFYAQFLPHMFPAGFYNTAAASVQRPSMLPYQKRYFAPYVLNSQQTPAATQPQLTPPTPTSTTSSATSAQQQHQPSTPTHQHSSNNRFICSRPDCLDCLDSYYKSSPFPYKSPILSPAASTVSSSSSYHSKAQKEVLLGSSNISLTSVTNIHLTTAKTVRESHLNAAYENRSSLSSTAEEISYKCRICDKVFGCSQTLQAHEKTHKSPRYECTDCGKGFSQLRNYKYHLSVHRGTKEFAAECPECGKTFNDKGYLSSHMKIHRNKKEYECPYCPKSFNQRVAFNMHVRIHTGVKPHKCAECGKRFSRKMLLKQHMRTHSGEKPYQCSVCGKSFADRSNMTLHHRLHSGIKPFNCPICPKAFTKKHHLKTHLNYHTGCKPYVCPHPNCNQAFTQSSNMRTHAKKCQYRPLQMAYPVAQKSNTNTTTNMNHSTILTAAAASAVTSSSLTSSLTTQNFMLNPISRLPSSMSLNVAGNHGTLPTISTSSSNSTNNNCNNSSSIPFIPSTTLAAGIRMLSTVTSASMSANTIQSSSSSTSSLSSTASSLFPPAQQPLLSTLRPF